MKYRRKWGKYQQLYFDSIVEKNLRLYYLPFPVFQSIIGQPKFKNIPVPGFEVLTNAINISEILKNDNKIKLVKFPPGKQFYKEKQILYGGGIGRGKKSMDEYYRALKMGRNIIENDIRRTAMIYGKFDIIEEDKEYCKNCGEEITYETRDTRYMHKYGRWEGDNGYFCFKDNNKLYAEKAGKINDK